ncbi:SDR family oxidoreductase [Paenibacillus aceti]|uniref:Epimerase n=1 Tax=Paenibacillus aceti TaxID=1820010 RepID=A0ABQ1W980_9BACL|nr:SDR family oxidoreductase [Paenibacillus aceti]GGG18367.1 epimerase [Paenibacillus aceti]
MTTRTGELHVVVGTGPLGMAVMEELLHRGRSVRMVNRSGQANAPSDVEVIRGDASDEASISQACKGASVIYNCAKAPYTEWPEKFPPMMNGIIHAAAKEEAKIVYGDNLYMYGSEYEVLTEDLPNGATGRKGRTRAQMAQQLLTAHHSGKVQATIGRGADFYGPRVMESSLGERVFQAALDGRPAEVLGNIDMPHTYLFIRDFAKGLVTLGEREEALGQSWHIPGAATLTTRQLINMVYDMAGKQPKFRVAPKPLVSLLALFNPDMREIKEMLYLFEKPFIVDTTKYEKTFGLDTTPHELAIAETLDWFRNRKG